MTKPTPEEDKEELELSSQPKKEEEEILASQPKEEEDEEAEAKKTAKNGQPNPKKPEEEKKVVEEGGPSSGMTALLMKASADASATAGKELNNTKVGKFVCEQATELKNKPMTTGMKAAEAVASAGMAAMSPAADTLKSGAVVASKAATHVYKAAKEAVKSKMGVEENANSSLTSNIHNGG